MATTCDEQPGDARPRQWRNRLLLVIGVCVVGAAFETAVAITDDQSLLRALLRWAGVAGLLVAFAVRPRTAPPELGATMGASGMITIASVGLFVVGPFLVG